MSRASNWRSTISMRSFSRSVGRCADQGRDPSAPPARGYQGVLVSFEAEGVRGLAPSLTPDDEALRPLCRAGIAPQEAPELWEQYGAGGDLHEVGKDERVEARDECCLRPERSRRTEG